MKRRLPELALTEDIIARRYAEGRGTGVGLYWNGWIKTTEISGSLSSRHRLKCGLHGAVHHLLSDEERDCFLFFDACKWALEIKDQFPISRDETLAIAEELGIKHPTDPWSKVPIVVTTDLVIRAHLNGQEIWLPRSVKPVGKFGDFNHAEHAEIERRWWARRGWVWKFLSNHPSCIHPQLLKNLHLLAKDRLLEDEDNLFGGQLEGLGQRFIDAMLACRQTERLSQFRIRFADHTGYSPDEIVRLSHWLIYNHQIAADLKSASIPAMDIMDLRQRSIDVANSNEILRFA